MPWVARLVDGPLDGGDVDRIMVGPFVRRLTFAFIPSFGGVERWTLVGVDEVPDPPWPQQTVYVTDDELEDPWSDDEANVARFRLESGA
jgi:hypothetical protein